MTTHTTPLGGAGQQRTAPAAVRTPRRANRTWPALLGLLAVTAAWGSTFPLLKDATSQVPAADYLALRFALAALVLAAMRPRGLVAMPRLLRTRAMVLGLLFGVCNLMLTIGLTYTSASVNGFLTGSYVVFTPLLAAALLRERVAGRVWTAIVVAAIGMGILAMKGGSGGAGAGFGEVITLAGALVCALYVVLLGKWSDSRYAIELAVIQSAVTAVVSGYAAVFSGPPGFVLPSGRAAWLGLIYMAVVVGALTMVLQTWAQAHLHPARAAVVMTMEPVWAAFFSVLIGGEVLGGRVWIGGSLVLGAMLLCELRTPPMISSSLLQRIPRQRRRALAQARAERELVHG